jgi:hypothetical protein
MLVCAWMYASTHIHTHREVLDDLHKQHILTFNNGSVARTIEVNWIDAPSLDVRVEYFLTLIIKWQSDRIPHEVLGLNAWEWSVTVEFIQHVNAVNSHNTGIDKKTIIIWKEKK